MNPAPRICVVIPVYDHALTLRQVVRGAREHLPVIAVNDGSTDATPDLLAQEEGITVVTLPANQGKAAALRAGFAEAGRLGFTHAITLDADGQHPTGALNEFAAAAIRQPDAFIIGVRDLRQEGAPWVRRCSNRLSTFWFRVETGVPLADTQCGYRCYALAQLRRWRLHSNRYAYELELLVRAAWAGVPLVPLPVRSDYQAYTSRLSHFRPGRDFVAIAWMHARLLARSLRRQPPQGS
jgi:glycosyltransferase involved in cell wall biosynthesis